MSSFLYPAAPASVDPSLLSPSSSFKKQVGSVVASILLFFIVYLVLVLLAVGLAIACFYFGALLIINVPRIATILIGLGLMALGISVVFFLIKFIFSVSKNENTSRVEIHEKDQPELFSFIRNITKETKTPFPRKIFLSPDVNACVFYNSSFWSMFFPVRKNLEIGLGLVNCINVSEFKAVIAHEFGHFSQRSMKLGSFTYNVNHIIYNMLYENTGYTSFLNSWATLNGYFSFFAQVTVKIAVTIQWVLRQMYQVINKNYLGLSREMEFHADAVSASVSGGNNLISALSRIELASGCYSTALDKASYLIKENKRSKNIFENQLTIFRSMAKEHKLPVKEGLPAVSFQFISSFSKSRVNYKNQWASHPTLEERKLHLEKLNIDAPTIDSLAWHLFFDRQNLQEKITANIYKHVEVKENEEHLDGLYFEEWYNREKDSFTLPALYKGFYNNRYVDVKDWDFGAMTSTESLQSFNEIFSEENAGLQSSITTNENDIKIIEAIKNKQIDVKTFDFDGNKYEVAGCDEVIKILEEEIAADTQKQIALDKKAFIFFYKNAPLQQEEMESLYKEYESQCKRYDDYFQAAKGVLNSINPFYAGNSSIADVRSAVEGLKAVHEKKLKEVFRNLVADKLITSEAKNNLLNRLAIFDEANYEYFAFDTFRNEELQELSDLTVKVADELNSIKFKSFKSLLVKQLEYLPNEIVK